MTLKWSIVKAIYIEIKSYLYDHHMTDVGLSGAFQLGWHALKNLLHHFFWIYNPFDPNEKIGSLGAGSDCLIRSEDQISYTIYFENINIATAPAQVVVISDILDPNLDWGTIDLTEIAFGDQVITVAPNNSYFNQVAIPDYRLNDNRIWLVDITAQLNEVTGKVEWIFRTLDPETGLPPEDPLAGFLPPNDGTGRGEGHVSFSIRPRAELTDGTVISNQASIVFDFNAPISTNIVTNMIDALPPEVLGVSPADGAPDIDIATTVVVTFTEAIDPDTVNLSFDPDVTGLNYAWDQTGTILSIDHDPLEEGTTYLVQIEGMDLVGNPMDAPYSWSFATHHTPIPEVTFSAGTYSINENDGTATITVNLTGSSLQTVTVGYTTSNGTATAGSDYVAAAGTLTFTPGQTSQTFQVTILDDAMKEADETINLSLSSPSHANLGSPTAATLTVIDDDFAVFIPSVSKP